MKFDSIDNNNNNEKKPGRRVFRGKEQVPILLLLFFRKNAVETACARARELASILLLLGWREPNENDR